MKAFTLESFEAQPGLRDDVPEPSPEPNEVIVRVQASSVNPVDVFVAGGALKDMAEHGFPVTLGRDFAGVVEQVGAGVNRFEVGDEVFGFVPHADPNVQAGSWAELIALPEDSYLAAKPDGIDAAAAGAAPVAALTAIAAFDALEPAEDSTVLVVGATGGVGSFFVQLASSAGVAVIAPALPEDQDYLRGLGVSEILDRNGDVAAAVAAAAPKGVDAIFDIVSQTPDVSVLKEDGRLASPVGAAGEGAGRFNVGAVSSPANHERLGGFLEARTLRVPIQRTFSLEQAGDAMETLYSAHTQGKLGIAVSSVFP
jgi:NADPH2:quinone reductase